MLLLSLVKARGCDSELDKLAKRFTGFRHFGNLWTTPSIKEGSPNLEQPKYESEMRSFLAGVKKHESYQTYLAATTHTVQNFLFNQSINQSERSNTLSTKKSTSGIFSCGNYLLHFAKSLHETLSSGSGGVPNAYVYI